MESPLSMNSLPLPTSWRRASNILHGRFGGNNAHVPVQPGGTVRGLIARTSKFGSSGRDEELRACRRRLHPAPYRRVLISGNIAHSPEAHCCDDCDRRKHPPCHQSGAWTAGTLVQSRCGSRQAPPLARGQRRTVPVLFLSFGLYSDLYSGRCHNAPRWFGNFFASGDSRQGGELSVPKRYRKR